jgi:hypothetical protein
MMVYLAADAPLPLVPWDEQKPGFHVDEISESEEGVREQFQKPYVVYVGSHEGCGCGFQYGKWPEGTQEAGELALCQASKAALSDYLTEQAGLVGRVELFACWDGDQEAIVEHQRSFAPGELAKPEFFFLEKELIAVGP